MQQTLINHPKLWVEWRTGSEGPRHDPYAFEELIVKNPKGMAVFHNGLCTWLKLNGTEVERSRSQAETYEDYERRLYDMFKDFVGYDQTQLQRIHRRLRSRCSRCGGKQFYDSPGYPGEHFEICSTCNHINDSHFCVSEIE